MGIHFPKQVKLNGADYFLLAIDHATQKLTRHGTLCQWVVELEGDFDTTEFFKRLRNSNFVEWMRSLCLRRGLPFSQAKWKSTKQFKLDIFEHPTLLSAKPIEHFFRADLNPQNGSLFSIEVLHGPAPKSHRLIFSWNHSLMDARGAELFLQLLGNNVLDQRDNPAFLAERIEESNSFRERLRTAAELKSVIYNLERDPVACIHARKSLKNSASQYRVVSFSADDTARLSQRAQEAGAGWIKSAFYLAATARALNFVLQAKGGEPGDMLVPVPQDLRKRGAFGPLLGNQITFLFYRIPQELLHDLKATTRNLIDQMQSNLRENIPNKYLTFMNLCRRLPLSWYAHFLRRLAKGKGSTFLFSDTGESLRDFQTFMGLPVTNAIHYPPNISPPGFTVIFSRFQDRLNATITYAKEIFSDEECEIFSAHLCRDLIGEDFRAEQIEL